MQVDDRIRVKAYKADGTCYRWWGGTVEAVEADGVVVVTPAGREVQEVDGACWVLRDAIRAFYWVDRRYNLLEVYRPDGEPIEIYVNVSSPVEIGISELSFTDYELDVIRELPHKARIVDQEEFRNAASKFGYSEEFQQTCYRAAREAVAVANRWMTRGMPDFAV